MLSPKSYTEALSDLKVSTLEAISEYIDMIQKLVDGDVNGYENISINEHAIQRERRSIGRYLGDLYYLESQHKPNESDIVLISSMIPNLMKVLRGLFGKKSVLIVDKYDTSFISALCFIKDNKIHLRIQKIYSNFLCKSLKVSRLVIKDE
ncbi:hypothetical protein EV175_005760 [Coemansia sp. RSA 1933]|nr:hypothetical protein EV175_005760 [Coemansia sp. RSA 1933]